LDAVKTDFITIASHELRTPLAQIRGHTDIIEALNEQGILDQEQLGALTSNLRKAADRLETLIGDMLDVSQLDLSAMDLRFAQATIENVVRLAIEPLQESIRSRKQSLTARGLRGLPAIEADMQRLVQAVRNIVLNAVKFTPDGGRIDIIGSLISNAQTGRDEIQVAIKDTGIGIDPKNHEAIFEKFFRTSDPGLHSTGATKFMGAGPGLGLTIARGVLQGHGGRIWVESPRFDPDKMPGSTFYIALPVHPPEGARRVMSFSTPGTRPKPPLGLKEAIEQQPPPAEEKAAEPVAAAADNADSEAPEPFIETNPTVINPAASRVGLTAAAKAAAEEALSKIESPQPPAEDSRGAEEAKEPPKS
jgi:signal transduction histidine kinase